MPNVDERPEPADASAEAETAGGTRVAQALRAIRRMILTGELMPGEQLRQDQLARRLASSRIPVREALTTLTSEGVLTHTPHAGFTVARFNGRQISEIYLMRRLLETELLRTVDFAELDADALERANEDLRQVAGETLLWRRKEHNRRFHFMIFAASPLAIVRDHVDRLWNMSEFVRSLYAYETESHERIVAEHARMIAAVRDRDAEALVAEADAHRAGAERLILQRVGGR